MPIHHLTPDGDPGTLSGFCVQLPQNQGLRAAFWNVFSSLTDPINWIAHGDMTPEDAAQAFSDAFWLSVDNDEECGGSP